MPKLFLIAITAFTSLVHPLHVSICEIEYDEKNKSLEIIQRIFIDDIEEEMRKKLNKPELDITEPEVLSTNDLLNNYLKQKLSIEVNGKTQPYEFLGYEIEGDAFFCYLEIEKVRKLKSIKVENNILTDHYDDQTNIVHVKVAGKNRSMKLSAQKRSDTLNY